VRCRLPRGNHQSQDSSRPAGGGDITVQIAGEVTRLPAMRSTHSQHAGE